MHFHDIVVTQRADPESTTMDITYTKQETNKSVEDCVFVESQIKEMIHVKCVMLSIAI